MVCDHVKDAGSLKSMGARISAVLSDKDRWGPLLVDLRKFHEIRNYKEARRGKKKQEPGKALRDQDKSTLATGTAEFFGLTEKEYQTFKWRWCVADWIHKGHGPEQLEMFMSATQADIDSCVEQFPKDVSFDEALDEHVGLKNAQHEFDVMEERKTDADPS